MRFTKTLIAAAAISTLGLTASAGGLSAEVMEAPVVMVEAMEKAGADALQYLGEHADRFNVLRLNVTGENQTLNEADTINWSGIRDAINPALIIAGGTDRPDPNLVEANANREFWEGIQKEEGKQKKVKKDKIKKEKVKKVKVKEEVPSNDIDDGSK